ncbi:hypothetical protein [Paenibacillus oceani]|uniref:Uncharacterized protein n=1 Tax=Paenibacillus oceani TaxID=2772510 RepID=A0A927CFL9_9BACL|nr:hypothetical protein [Paenibacillus oceani]MBD2865326.1 hypothetical protein [Paenibacillus oceani]
MRRNIAYLSEKSWHTNAAADDFIPAYTAALVKDHREQWAEGFRCMRSIFGNEPTMWLLKELTVGFGTKDPKRPYPARIIESLRAAKGTTYAYKAIVITLEKALQSFQAGMPMPRRESELAVYRWYCRQIIVVIRCLLQFADAVDRPEQAGRNEEEVLRRLQGVCETFAQAVGELDSVMQEMQTVLPFYLIPSGLREYTFLREALIEYTQE